MMKHIFGIICIFALLACVLHVPSAASEEGSAQVSSNSTTAKQVKYSNKKSGLRAKTVQGAIDEMGSTISALISGKTKASGAAHTAGSATTWTGKIYFYVGTPGETLHEEPVTMTFSATSESGGTLTTTPINFLCEIAADFVGDPIVCGQYGDTFTYTYRIFGTNLFVENGRNSSGGLVGAGNFGGEVAEIQSQGQRRLVLKFVDNVTSIWDLALQD